MRDYKHMRTYRETEKEVLKWADDRNLLNRDANAVKTQALKLVSEVGELADSLTSYQPGKNDLKDVVDAIGDTMVVIAILCDQIGLDPETCFECAYEEIKNRSGKTIGGVFIKDK